ncbi:MAG: uncharacterized protein QOD65_1997 [Gaiellales bacterium]|nr:uncharacterized protein [Gaiellales bacterium]
MWRPADIASALRQPRTLVERAHRPWPVPERPWVMGQTWENLLFAHWRVDEAALRRVVPAAIPIDTFDGSAWLAVTPFYVTGMRTRLTPPLPGLARFPEINVRTYATIEGRPGIYFFSLDTTNRPAVATARRVYRLPYFRARMKVEPAGDRIRYDSDRSSADGPAAAAAIEYGPTGPCRTAVPGTFEHWAAERYCLYTLDDDGRVLRGDIHHPPWPLQPASATFARNSMADQVGIALDGDPVLHYARRQDVVFWLNEPV